MKNTILQVIVFISILLLISCTESITTDNGNTQVKIEKNDLIENNINVTICSDTKLLYRQINKLYLCIESDIKMSEIDFLDMDLGQLKKWNIYIENKGRCNISSDLCFEKSNCSQKLVPVSGTFSVKRNGNILTFSFSDSRWISNGVELNQGANQFSVEI